MLLTDIAKRFHPNFSLKHKKQDRHAHHFPYCFLGQCSFLVRESIGESQSNFQSQSRVYPRTWYSRGSTWHLHEDLIIVQFGGCFVLDRCRSSIGGWIHWSSSIVFNSWAYYILLPTFPPDIIYCLQSPFNQGFLQVQFIPFYMVFTQLNLNWEGSLTTYVMRLKHPIYTNNKNILFKSRKKQTQN